LAILPAGEQYSAICKKEKRKRKYDPLLLKITYLNLGRLGIA